MKEQLIDLHNAAKEACLQVKITNGMGTIASDGTIHTESGTLILKDIEGGPAVASVHFENADGTYPNNLPEFSQAVEMVRRIVGDGPIE